MTDSASQSLVDLDLLIAVCEKAARSSFAVTIDPVPVLPVVKAAAARITELEAELWRTKNDLANANDNYHEVSTRFESELSRVEVETIERCANFLAREYPDNANTNAFCAAIRSLPPLAKRGEQKRPQIAEFRAAEDSETKSAGGEA